MQDTFDLSTEHFVLKMDLEKYLDLYSNELGDQDLIIFLEDWFLKRLNRDVKIEQVMEIK